MVKLKWLIISMSALLFPCQPQEAFSINSIASDSQTNYIVATLDEFIVLGPQTFLPAVFPVRLMLGAVAASGSRIQKVLWPSQSWSDGIMGSFESNAIPLFALPEDQLGNELGFALIVLDNTIPADQHPEDWLNNGLPAVMEAAAEPVALWVTGQTTSSKDLGNAISERIEPHLGGNALAGVIATKLKKTQDWGVSDRGYEVANFNLQIRYHVRRVSVPQGASVEVRLKGISLEKSETFAGTWKGTDPEDGSTITLSLTEAAGLLDGTYADTFSPGNPPIAPGFSGPGTGEVISDSEATMTFNLDRPDGVHFKVDKVRLRLSNLRDTLTMSDFVVNGQPFPQQRPVVMQQQPVELFAWARAASGFSGEALSGLVRRLPFAQTYTLKAGETQALDEVLYNGDLSAFLYTELGVWDQRAQGPVSLGTLSNLWTVTDLVQPPGSFSATVRGFGGQATLNLTVDVTGLPVPSAAARTLQVPAAFSTIQAAIDAAQSGDTIVVANGLYRENLVIAKSLTLRGSNARVQGVQPGHPVAQVESDVPIRVTLEGLSLLDSQVFSASKPCANVAGPNFICPDGITIRGTVVVEIFNVTLSDKVWGMTVWLGQVRMVNSVISDSRGVGLDIRPEGTVTIENTRITGDLIGSVVDL